MLTTFLESYFQDAELKQIFQDVVGTDQINILQSMIDESIMTHLKSNVVKIIFLHSSIGVVFGFLLGNDQKVVLKIYSQKITKSYLDEMHWIQNIFYTEQFPVPKILSPIFKFGSTHAGLYQLIEGKTEDAHQASIRLELAKYLADFSKIVEKHNMQPVENFFQQASRRKLWPISHNSLFDFKKTTRGAGWIAKKAMIARKILATDQSNKKLAHTDWGTKNAIFCNNKLKGIFDWDSLGAMTELEMLGRACAQFTADWEAGFKITPSPEEGRFFVQEYQNHRCKKFADDDFKIISASADYLIATIARFEYAGNNPNIHPYQDLLKECEKQSFLFI